jgi:hypothetical protein
MSEKVTEQNITIRPGKILSKALGNNAEAQAYFADEASGGSLASVSVSGGVSILPPLNPAVPNLNSVSSPDSVGRCDPLVINAGSVSSAGGLTSVYKWKVLAPPSTGATVHNVTTNATLHNANTLIFWPQDIDAGEYEFELKVEYPVLGTSAKTSIRVKV